MFLVGVANKEEAREGEQREEEMPEFGALLPRAHLGRVGLRIVVFTTGVEPMSVGVDVGLVKVAEFVDGVMLQIVGYNLFVVRGLWLVLEAV